MTERVKNWLWNSRLYKKFKKPICNCSVCGKPMNKIDVVSGSSVYYDIREPAELHSKISIEIEPSLRPGENHIARIDDRGIIKFDPPLRPGESYEFTDKINLENGALQYAILKIGVPVCKNCSQKYDPLTILKKARVYLKKRDGEKTYHYLEGEIRKLEK